MTSARRWNCGESGYAASFLSTLMGLSISIIAVLAEILPEPPPAIHLMQRAGHQYAIMPVFFGLNKYQCSKEAIWNACAATADYSVTSIFCSKLAD